MQLRWLAVVGQVATILYVNYALGIELPLQRMAAVVVVLISLNILSLYLARAQESIFNAEIFLALLVDVAALTAQLYFSGGATNPFVSLYLLQVTLGAVLLQTWGSWTLVVVVGLSFVWLTTSDETGVIPDFNGGTFGNLHVQGIFICFILSATLSVFFITRINRNLSARDQHLADLRQQSVEEDHIVRLGLMASGAAHELGTPLATLSVILNDWQHMPDLQANPVVVEEIAEMQAQVARCKTILSGILMSSGEARGEGTIRTTMRGFFDALAAEWRSSRSPAQFQYINDFHPNTPVIAETAVKQVIFNVLDNALEASPHWVCLKVEREAGFIVMTVRDHGPGFSPEMLQSLGKPYRSTKDRPGHGLGLFLVVNVVRKLGGSVTATNAPDGGACVRIVVAVDAISPELQGGER